jgi:ABC-type transport system involved in cytochrome bd biosynthesis fused ATPase/permease subunit
LHQSSKVFYGSVAENIYYGISKEDNYEKNTLLLSALGIDKKMEHNVGESGEFLSGGEEQKIKLCRELLRPCDMLILDEPLNNLDAASSKYLKENIQAISKDKIVIIVSHTEDFDIYADEKITIQNGSIE